MPQKNSIDNNADIKYETDGAIIFNITVKVEKSIVQLWLQWITVEIAPFIIGTNCFTKFTVLKLLELDDAESSTYALQFFSNSLEDYQRYIQNFSNDFTGKSFLKWGERTVSFSTVMQVVL
jgi:hypothetical protein